MLVMVSDLHFVDNSAGKHNVSSDAFKIFFNDLASTCDWIKKDKGVEIQEIKLVFLGDIFDLLRTEMWFDHPLDERPWGNNSDLIEKHANSIFDKIVEVNKATFLMLGGRLQEQFSLPVEPKRIFIPGNHDRLCNKFVSLRAKVRNELALDTDASIPFPSYIEDYDYGLFARHGHEYDEFNYEGSDKFSYEDYMKTPIGDPITTELIAKIPWKIAQQEEVRKLPTDEREKLISNFQEIENVRPFGATLQWLLYQVHKKPNLKGAIDAAVDEVIKEFRELPFVMKWYSRHDKWTNPVDEADKIQAVLFLLDKFSVFSFKNILQVLDKVNVLAFKDDYQKAAVKEYRNMDERLQYIVYGHSHTPRHVPLSVGKNGNNSDREYIYLNSGTWRSRHYKTEDGLGFSSGKNLTYISFYKKEERKTKYPSFESWTGRMKTLES